MTENIWPYGQGSSEQPRERQADVPLISIVVPSYNQAQFLEATLLSIIHQRDPNVEIIVMDGGSTDGSVDIIRRYASWLTHWQSEKDGGQVPALNKGFAMSRGEILGWLNSDDIFLPGALKAIRKALRNGRHPDSVVGKALLINEHGIPYRAVCGLPPTRGSMLFWSSAGYVQPAAFWNRAAAEAVGELNANYRLAFDADFFLRLATVTKIRRLNYYIAGFRHHPASITETLDARRLEEDYQLRCLLHGLKNYPAWYRSTKQLYYKARYFAYAGLFKARVMAELEKPPIALHQRRD